jgi:hypothetical protein
MLGLLCLFQRPECDDILSCGVGKVGTGCGCNGASKAGCLLTSWTSAHLDEGEPRYLDRQKGQHREQAMDYLLCH